ASPVPGTTVANAPETNLREAEQAPRVESAQTEAPVAEAPPQAAPPPVPQPAPTPSPKKLEKPARPEKSLDLDALAASLSKSTARPAPAKPSSAAQGPARPETALQSRPALGTGASAAAVSGL